MSLPLPTIGQPNSTEDQKVLDILTQTQGALVNANLSGSAGITPANLASAAKPVTWYAPSVIATEEARTNTAYAVLTTPDKVSSVVMPTNGIIVIGFQAMWKESVQNASRAAIFIGANQLKFASNSGAATIVQEAQTSGSGNTNKYVTIASSSMGLQSSSQPATEYGGDATTGQVIGNAAVSSSGGGGVCYIFAAAGTYDISVQFKASSGTVTAKNRNLWVYTLGY